MKREALGTLNSARRGDNAARVIVGHHYLHGAGAFPQQRATGINYLRAAAAAGHREAAWAIADSIALGELVQHGLIGALRNAALEGSLLAQYKLGLWLLTDATGRVEGASWLRLAASSGFEQARVVLARSGLFKLSDHVHADDVRLLLAAALQGRQDVLAALARAALEADDLPLFASALRVGYERAERLGEQEALLVVRALLLERRGRIEQLGLPASAVRDALEISAGAGSAEAMYLLGRVLAGSDECLRKRAGLVASRKLGRGISWLLRAADAGEADAYLELAETYERHPRLPCSFRMARYYLERAADCGIESAIVRLGRALLTSARSPAELLRAVERLYPAAMRGNDDAHKLLSTLTDPPSGDAARAERALSLISAHNPLLAVRLALARAFGLARHEALTVDVPRARRPWGLWIDPGAFFTQRTKSTPRPVPALNQAARDLVVRAETIFEHVQPGPDGSEGDYRARDCRLRAVLARANAEESLFLVRRRAANHPTARVDPPQDQD